MTNATPSDRRPSPSRGLLIAAGVAAGVLILILILALTGAFGGGGNSGRAASREVSVQGLRDYASSKHRTVYWLGAIPGRRLELTEAQGNVWVRYLTGDAVVGDGRPAFTTVGTYPYRSALTEVRRRSKAKGMQSRGARNGGLATWSGRRPSSVYVAFPNSNLLIEVYDPDPGRARTFAVSSDLKPVR